MGISRRFFLSEVLIKTLPSASPLLYLIFSCQRLHYSEFAEGLSRHCLTFLLFVISRMTPSMINTFSEDTFSWDDICLFSEIKYRLKVNNIQARRKCKICPKVDNKGTRILPWCCFDFVIIRFEYISRRFLVFILFTLNG